MPSEIAVEMLFRASEKETIAFQALVQKPEIAARTALTRHNDVDRARDERDDHVPISIADTMSHLVRLVRDR